MTIAPFVFLFLALVSCSSLVFHLLSLCFLLFHLLLSLIGIKPTEDIICLGERIMSHTKSGFLRYFFNKHKLQEWKNISQKSSKIFRDWRILQNLSMRISFRTMMDFDTIAVPKICSRRQKLLCNSIRGIFLRILGVLSHFREFDPTQHKQFLHLDTIKTC